MPIDTTERLRVQSVPAAHPYVLAALPDPRLDPVTLLADPVVDPADPGRWWPPRALDPQWLDAHGDNIDVLHVHFGFDTSDPDQFRELAAVARRHGIAVVATVHDLHNPHQPDPGPHRERLGALVGSADAVLTLTEGAAEEVARRWGRRPVVLPHPHLAAGGPHPDRRDPTAPLVGVHLKDLRPNTDTDTVLDAIGILADSGSVRCQVRVHTPVLSPRHPRHDPALPARLDDLAAHDGVEVIVHHRLDDTGLAAALSALDVAVLPYRFGTHSGWLQLCRDLGVRVAAPDCGHYRDQVEPAALAEFTTGEASSLVDAVLDLLGRPGPDPTSDAERCRRREVLRRVHLETYRAALDRVRR